jgi:hypothetical protein
MKVADLDFQRLIGPAGSAERHEDAETDQKPEHIKPPKSASHALFKFDLHRSIGRTALSNPVQPSEQMTAFRPV